MEQLLLNASGCKGCGYCVHFCPKQALRPEGAINSKGYTTAVVNKEKCISCGICCTVCPDYVFEIREV